MLVRGCVWLLGLGWGQESWDVRLERVFRFLDYQLWVSAPPFTLHILSGLQTLPNFIITPGILVKYLLTVTFGL